MAEMKKVFVSSVYQGLKEYRDEIAESIDKCDDGTVVNKNFGARPDSPLKECISLVESSDVFIGLVGPRYGSRPPSPDDDLSFTEHEYEAAVRCKLQLLMVVIPDDFPSKPSPSSADKTDLESFGKDQNDLKKFREKVGRNQMAIMPDGIEVIGSPQKLANWLLSSFHNLSLNPKKPVRLDALNFASYMEQKREGFHGREWIMRKINEWRNSDKSRGLLIEAEYGVGKSALMAQLTELHQVSRKKRKENDHYVCAHYFFQFDYYQTRIPENFVLTLADQLLDRLPNFRDAVERNGNWNKQFRTKGRENGNKFDPKKALMEVVLPSLRDTLPATSNYVVVIDAFDEGYGIEAAATKESEALAELIVSCAKGFPNWLKLVVTSRPIDEITKKLQPFNYFDVLKIDKSCEGNRQDVERYIHERLSDGAIAERLQHDGFSIDDIFKHVRDNCGYKFLYVNHLFSAIHKGEINIREILKFPPGMDPLYCATFGVRFNSDDEYKSARKILGIFCISYQPLPERIICKVLNIDVNIVNELYQKLKDFLTKRELGEKGEYGFTFNHFSLEEWLRDGARSNKFSADLKYAEEQLCLKISQIAKDGVAWLSRSDKFNLYVAMFGVRHFINQYQYNNALILLRALDDSRPELTKASIIQSSTLSILVAQHAKAIAEAIGEALEKNRKRGDVTCIDPEHLCWLIGRTYETGVYVPVIRVLIEYAPEAWDGNEREEGEYKKRLKKPYDIVFRHDVGEAFAEIWKNSTVSGRDQIMARLKAMAMNTTSSYDREIAGYALQDIFLLLREENEDREESEDVDWGLVRAYANSPYPYDRMVAGELMIALMLDGEEDIRGKIDSEIFWNPIWDYHRIDVEVLTFLSKEKEINASDSVTKYEEQKNIRTIFKIVWRRTFWFVGLD